LINDMTDSLRDQLLKLGFKKPDPPARPPAQPQQRQGANAAHKPASAPATNKGSAQKPGSGKPNPHQRPHQATKPQPARPQPAQPSDKPARSQEEIDLARAYALRERQEREERERSKREAEAKAQERREKRQKLRVLMEGKSRNDAEADLLRHFPQGDKIKRVHVNAEQLQRLNAGELGVVQMEGRYHLVDRETALLVRSTVPEALVLLPEPGDASDDDWSQAPEAESAAS
jgi:uncharacterized protein